MASGDGIDDPVEGLFQFGLSLRDGRPAGSGGANAGGNLRTRKKLISSLSDGVRGHSGGSSDCGNSPISERASLRSCPKPALTLVIEGSEVSVFFSDASFFVWVSEHDEGSHGGAPQETLVEHFILTASLRCALAQESYCERF